MVTVTAAADTEKPVITLDGDNPMDVLQGSTFIDPGATATDNVDSTVTVAESGTVDTSTVGSYTRTYTATDTASNIATETRTVNVVASDWYTYEDDGETVKYTTADGESEVNFVPGLFDIVANDDGIVFRGKTSSSIGDCQVRVSIIMKNNGDMIAGYTHVGNGCSNDTDEFSPGTKVSVGNDMVLFIETLLTEDLNLGGK